MKTLNIVSVAYRGTIEEQDDTILWLCHAMKSAGAEIGVLLRGAAVNYAVVSQGIDPVQFGGRLQKHAPDIPGELKRLVEKGTSVYILKEDLERRGLDTVQLLDCLIPVANKDVCDLFSNYDQVWHW